MTMLFHTLSIWCMAALLPQTLHAVNLDSMLRVLDTCITLRPHYEKQFCHLTDSLRHAARKASSPRQAMKLWLWAGNEETYHNSRQAVKDLDQALALARRLNDTETQCDIICTKAFLYGNWGLPWHGEKLLESIPDKQSLSFRMRQRIYTTYTDIHDFYRQGNLPDEIPDQQLEQIETISDSTQKYLNSKAMRAYTFQQSTDNLQEMIDAVKEYLDSVPNRQKAMLAAVLANKYNQLRDMKQRDYYWAMSAVYSLRYTAYEYEPLTRLAARMAESGQHERAARYSLAACQMAQIWGSNIRKAELAPLLAKELEHSRQTANRTTNQLGGWQVATILLALLVIFILIRFRNRRGAVNPNTTPQAMPSDDQPLVNEQATRFLDMGLDAIFEVEQMRRMVLMRLQAKETERLQKSLSDVNRFDEFRRTCLRRFDLTFLRLHPGFVEKVNRLFKPDEQISLSDTELLNNELRTIAFQKIGVNDGPRIAVILGVSVNTVYFYRNRTKKRLLNKTTFEDDVKSL